MCDLGCVIHQYFTETNSNYCSTNCTVYMCGYHLGYHLVTCTCTCTFLCNKHLTKLFLCPWSQIHLHVLCV